MQIQKSKAQQLKYFSSLLITAGKQFNMKMDDGSNKGDSAEEELIGYKKQEDSILDFSSDSCTTEEQPASIDEEEIRRKIVVKRCR